jgi:hypothetical protein
MIYLVEFTLHTQEYPDSNAQERLMRLVEAADESLAESKLVEYYDKQSEPYDVSYRVRDITVDPTIT